MATHNTLRDTASAQFNGSESPTGTDTAAFESLEYLTVDNYQWPKSGPPPRTRMSEHERKRRHREIQRQSVARKRAHVRSLVDAVRLHELRLRLLQATHEVRVLAEENEKWRTELQARWRPNVFSVPAASASFMPDSAELDPLLAEAFEVLAQPVRAGKDLLYCRLH